MCDVRLDRDGEIAHNYYIPSFDTPTKCECNASISSPSKSNDFFFDEHEENSELPRPMKSEINDDASDLENSRYVFEKYCPSSIDFSREYF